MARKRARTIDAVSNSLFRRSRAGSGKQMSKKRVRPTIKLVHSAPSTWKGGKQPSPHVKNLHMTLGKRQKAAGFKLDPGRHGQRRDRKGRFT